MPLIKYFVYDVIHWTSSWDMDKISAKEKILIKNLRKEKRGQKENTETSF